MLTTRPHLTTLRPSPSTVSYTVSTASPRQTIPAQCLHYFLLLCRILTGLATLLVLCTKATTATPPPPLAPLSEHLARFPWVQVGPLAFTSLFLVFRRFHTGKIYIYHLSHPPTHTHSLFLAKKKKKERKKKYNARNPLPGPPIILLNPPLINNGVSFFFGLNRRIPPDAPHPRHSNQHPLLLLPPPERHALHTDVSDPRHLHPRGLQGVRSEVLPRGGGGGGGGGCGCVSGEWLLIHGGGEWGPGLSGWVVGGEAEADDGSRCRICYQGEGLWRRCGGGRGSACMSRKDDGMDSCLVILRNEIHGMMPK